MKKLASEIVAASLALALVAGAARADRAAAPGSPATAVAPAALKEAKARFALGKALEDKGEYDGAIAEYRSAYALAPLPELIFNIAQCERLKGDRRAAIADFQRYLAVSPATGRGAAEARQFVDALGPEVAAEDAAKEAAAKADSEAQRRKESADREAAASEAAARARREAQAEGRNRAVVAGEENPLRPVASAEESKPRPVATAADTHSQASEGRAHLRLGGAIVAGAGVALIAGGLVFGLQAKSASDRLGELKAGATWDQGLYDSGKADQRNMFILLGIGGAALVGGGVTYFLGRRGEPGDTTVVVLPTPQGATLGIATRL